MRKITAQENKTLPIAGAFIGIVLAIIFVSFSINFFIVLSHSKFDGNHQFVLSVQDTSRQAEVIIYTPETQSLSLVNVRNFSNPSTVGQEVEIPIDGIIIGHATSLDEVNLLLQQSRGRRQLQWIDALKLWWYGHQIKSENFMTTTIDLSNTSSNLDATNNVTDKTLYNENKTVAIINASGVTGKGNQLAKLLTNIGANVISVTGDKEQDVSSISYVDAPTYTVKRIHAILGYPMIQLSPRPTIATITIVIGKDSSISDIF